MSSNASSLTGWPPLIRALHAAACYPHPVAAVRVVETHISWILLTGTYAYKIKKPVKLSFLDFSTLALRRRYCADELAINQRLAADLYVDVVPIGGSVTAPMIGQTPAFEYAVRMRQFDQTCRLDNRLRDKPVTELQVCEFADTIAAFHQSQSPQADVEPQPNSATENIDGLRQALQDDRFTTELQRLSQWTLNASRAMEATIQARIAGGRYRDCHGDLHLENVVVLDQQLIAFDALEFDRKLRVIDVIDEAAFFAMDLQAHGRSDLAFAFLSRYLETSGDYAGIDALRFYIVYRALVRAKVCALKIAHGLRSEQSITLRTYLESALTVINPTQPLVVVTHGFSGSGKTYLTDRLIGPLQAVRIRSDLERKRLMRLPALASSHSPVGGGAYDAATSKRTYQILLAGAERAVRHGFNCIVDGTFLLREERQRLRQMCVEAGARFAIMDCVAPDLTLRHRIRQRAAARRDASEADIDVLDHQIRTAVPLTADEKSLTLQIDTTGAIDRLQIASRLERTAR